MSAEVGKRQLSGKIQLQLESGVADPTNMTLQETSGRRSIRTRSMSLGSAEARVMLRTALGPYCQAGYHQLRDMAGHSTTFETKGPSGVAYRVDCFVNQVSPDDQMVTVAGIATEVGTGGLHQDETSLGFSVLSDGTIF